MRKYFYGLCILLLPLVMFAQFETDYKPVLSKGALPKDFVTRSSDKYVIAKAELEKNEKKATRKAKEKFLLQTSFGVDEMLLSGKVVFNDPLAEYVNKVADKLLANDQTLRSQVRFYILRSSAVNAFATNQGVIFVTMGLLAQLENEAQLAFILAHEINHYTEKHAIEKYLEVENIERGKGSYTDLTFDDKDLAKSVFSKEQEKEADEKGILLFLKSGYSTQYLMGVYDVLKYAYLPFDDITFDKTFLENKYLKFPDGYVVKETKPIDIKDIEDDDDRSTHPSIVERRAYTDKAIGKADNTGKSTYLVGESQFNKVREMARFELCRLYTLHRRYEAGIYTSYMLLKKYPNNLYLKKNVAYCLAGLSEYSNEDEFSEVHKKADKIEGKGQAVFHLMHKLDSIKGDMNVVALAYTLKLKNEYGNDKEIEELYKHLLSTLVHKADKKLNNFSETEPTADTVSTAANATTTSTAKVDSVVDEMSKSKYEKLRQQETQTKYENGLPGNLPFTAYAFIEYMQDGKLQRDFEKASKEKEDKESINLDATRNRYNRKEYNKVFALGIDKIVIVDPYYARIDAQKKEKLKYLETEGGQVDFVERLKLNAKKAKLEVEVLNTKNLVESETEKMNEISVLDEYISERLSHENDIEIPYAERERVQEIAKKYDTKYFMWTGAVALSNNSGRRTAGLIVLSVLMPPSMLFTLPRLINGGFNTVYFSLVYNVETDELKYATYRDVQNRTKGYILNSHIYDSFNQIKSKKKGKK